MASSLLKLTTLLFLVITLLLALHTQVTLSIDMDDDIDDDDEETYVLDSTEGRFRSNSRFLLRVIKKGAQCNPTSYNICNGVPANKGTGLLYCCKKHCRNVLGDKNNCGRCGHKCGYGEACCYGKCINILNNEYHCGKCNRQCAPGVKCENRSCGYA